MTGEEVLGPQFNMRVDRKRKREDLITYPQAGLWFPAYIGAGTIGDMSTALPPQGDNAQGAGSTGDASGGEAGSAGAAGGA